MMPDAGIPGRRRAEHQPGGQPGREDAHDDPGPPAIHDTREAQPELKIIVTFDRPGMQRAFTDWVESGDCYRALWTWMSYHGYHA
jgi:hypothetical protein